MTDVIETADALYENVRAINHVLINQKAMPAQDVYQMLGNLQATGYGLQQVCDHLARMLEASLTVYEVTEDDGSDPAVRNKEAVELLRNAAMRAQQLGEVLATAQNTINRQVGRHRA